LFIAQNKKKIFNIANHNSIFFCFFKTIIDEITFS